MKFYLTYMVGGERKFYVATAETKADAIAQLSCFGPFDALVNCVRDH